MISQRFDTTIRSHLTIGFSYVNSFNFLTSTFYIFYHLSRFFSYPSLSSVMPQHVFFHLHYFPAKTLPLTNISYREHFQLWLNWFYLKTLYSSLNIDQKYDQGIVFGFICGTRILHKSLILIDCLKAILIGYPDLSD